MSIGVTLIESSLAALGPDDLTPSRRLQGQRLAAGHATAADTMIVPCLPDRPRCVLSPAEHEVED